MKRCNGEHQLPPQSGPVQGTGSRLHPGVVPCPPMQLQPIPPVRPKPIDMGEQQLPPPQSGPVQNTGSGLYPDVPTQFQPIPPTCPKTNGMKRCNDEHQLPHPQSGPAQHTGSRLYPDVAPCPPMQFQPILPVCPKPIPEPCPVSSDNKTVIVEGAGDVTVTRKDGVYDTTYTVSFDGFEKLQPFTQEELTELFDPVDDGGI